MGKAANEQECDCAWASLHRNICCGLLQSGRNMPKEPTVRAGLTPGDEAQLSPASYELQPKHKGSQCMGERVCR